MRARVEMGEREAGTTVEDGGGNAGERSECGDREYRASVRILRCDGL
jgi:hypothetical protein